MSESDVTLSAASAFEPVPVRPRRDGWSPARQVEFIEALAECGCVADAARRVGKTVEGAYALRCRTDAVSFRLAGDAALDLAIRHLGDAVRRLRGRRNL